VIRCGSGTRRGRMAKRTRAGVKPDGSASDSSTAGKRGTGASVGVAAGAAAGSLLRPLGAAAGALLGGVAGAGAGRGGEPRTQPKENPASRTTAKKWANGVTRKTSAKSRGAKGTAGKR